MIYMPERERVHDREVSSAAHKQQGVSIVPTESETGHHSLSVKIVALNIANLNAMSLHARQGERLWADSQPFE